MLQKFGCIENCDDKLSANLFTNRKQDSISTYQKEMQTWTEQVERISSISSENKIVVKTIIYLQKIIFLILTIHFPIIYFPIIFINFVNFCRYKLLLEELLQNTNENSDDYNAIRGK